MSSKELFSLLDSAKEAVVRWAQKTGRWGTDALLRSIEGSIEGSKRGERWVFLQVGGGFEVFCEDHKQEVSNSTALLLALLIESGLIVDVGRCCRCRGTGVSWSLGVSNDCDACLSSGRDVREVAELVLGASIPSGSLVGLGLIEREHLIVFADRLQGEGYGAVETVEGSEVTIPAEPTGEWLAQWIVGSEEWVADGIAALERLILVWFSLW